jgi:hypothetical protein
MRTNILMAGAAVVCAQGLLGSSGNAGGLLGGSGGKSMNGPGGSNGQSSNSSKSYENDKNSSASKAQGSQYRESSYKQRDTTLGGFSANPQISKSTSEHSYDASGMESSATPARVPTVRSSRLGTDLALTERPPAIASGISDATSLALRSKDTPPGRGGGRGSEP